MKFKFMKEKWAVLFGAGVSIDWPSNLPSGTQLSHCIADYIILDKHKKTIFSYIDADIVKIREGHYVKFEQLVEYIFQYYESKQLLAFLGYYSSPNRNHFILSNLADNNFLLLTTNFDTLVEDASVKINKPLAQVVFSNDTQEVPVSTSKLYKLHGTAAFFDGIVKKHSTDTLCANIQRIIEYGGIHKKTGLTNFLKHVIENYNLIVVGYSGFDDFDISPILQSTKSTKQILWVEHSKELENKPYMVFSLPQFKGLPNSKSKLLLETIYATGSRNIDSIFLLKGHTESVLSSILEDTGGGYIIPDLKQKNNINYTDEIANWIQKRISFSDKIYFTTALLTFLEEHNRTISIVNKLLQRDQIDLELNNKANGGILVNLSNSLIQTHNFNEKNWQKYSKLEPRSLLLKSTNHFDDKIRASL